MDPDLLQNSTAIISTDPPMSVASDNAEKYWEDSYRPRANFYDRLLDRHCGTRVPRECISLAEYELRVVQAQSALFYRRINALRPVSRLSTELLSLVFHHLSDLEPTIPSELDVREDPPAPHTPIATWMKVTHVSYTFRQCALGDRSLWHATTTVFGPDWMNLLVERSRTFPQSVHVGFGAPSLSEMRPLFQHAHAVQITWVQPKGTRAKSMFALSEVRSLKIHLSDHQLDRRWKSLGLNDYMPHLTDLHVHVVPDFNLSRSCIASSLTSLYIGADPFDSMHHSMQHILDTLVRLPRLQSLTVARCILETSDAIVSRSVSAPALRHLSIKAEVFLDVVQFLDALELSIGVSVHLAGKPPATGADSEGWTVLQRTLSHPIWANIHTLELLGLPEDQPEMYQKVQHDDDGSFMFSAWNEDDPSYVCIEGQAMGERYAQLRMGTTRDLRPKPDLCLQLTEDLRDRAHWSGVLNATLMCFRSAAKIRTLSMRPGTMAVDVKTPWPDIFTHHPRLTSIRIEHQADFDCMFAALYFAQEVPAVPQLRAVSFAGAWVPTRYWERRVTWTDPTNGNEEKCGERGALFAEALMKRMAVGVPLSKFYLQPRHLGTRHLWSTLGKGSSDESDFMAHARQLIEPVKLWNWKEWGIGL